MRIAVLYGGVSGEREVSLATGAGIVNALKKNGYDVLEIDFNPKNLTEIIQLKVDLVFIALHGTYGEDGRIQGLLDMLEIPYVGSNVLASALAMDKGKAKQVFKQYDIPMAKSKVYHVTDTNHAQIVEDVLKHFTPPFVMKPNREGSTLGLSMIRHDAEVADGITMAANSDHMILVEDFIEGVEVTVPIIGAKGKEETFPVIEIVPKNEFYDYESKYTDGGSEHIIPARLEQSTLEKIQAYALKAHQALGCETYSRVDFIVTEDQIPMILEVNTLPGMTETSLFPSAAKAIGLEYETMIENIIQLAIKDKQ